MASPVSIERPGPLPRLHLGVESVARATASTLERAVGAQGKAWKNEVGDPPLVVAQLDLSHAGGSVAAAKVVQFSQAVAEPLPPFREPVDAGLPADADPAHAAPVAEPDCPRHDQADVQAFAALDAAGPADFPHEPPQSGSSDAGALHLGEQVLRELVRELILAELNGTLGERMTRNVRKLVRAEIARAMSLRQAE
jgi:hypothetical protein